MNNRQPTFTVIGDSPSMIDDMTLLRLPTKVGSTAVHAAEIQQVHGYNTDHALLTASLSIWCKSQCHQCHRQLTLHS
jgi:cbb3-type cytochrome oxidase cytochrome c subunit